MDQQDNKPPENLLVGGLTADTLMNVVSVLTLLRQMHSPDYEIFDQGADGLYLINGLMLQALLHEISTISNESVTEETQHV